MAPSTWSWRSTRRGGAGPRLTDPAIEIPDAAASEGATDAIPVTYVPARNLVFLAVAMGVSEARAPTSCTSVSTRSTTAATPTAVPSSCVPSRPRPRSRAQARRRGQPRRGAHAADRPHQGRHRAPGRLARCTAAPHLVVLSRRRRPVRTLRCVRVAGEGIRRGGCARPRDARMTLVVSEVFGPTLQGEGPSAGQRAGFVRLGRCSLSCSWCDTPYSWDWKRYDPAVELRELAVGEVAASIRAMDVPMVVVTGGEPLLQQRVIRRAAPVAARARCRGGDERHPRRRARPRRARRPLQRLTEAEQRRHRSEPPLQARRAALVSGHRQGRVQVRRVRAIRSRRDRCRGRRMRTDRRVGDAGGNRRGPCSRGVPGDWRTRSWRADGSSPRGCTSSSGATSVADDRAPQRSEERRSRVAGRCSGRGTRHGGPLSDRQVWPGQPDPLGAT